MSKLINIEMILLPRSTNLELTYSITTVICLIEDTPLLGLVFETSEETWS